MKPMPPMDLHALNAERLRQWAEQLSQAEASALLVLGVRAETGRVTVLWPEGAAVCDLISVLLHAANIVAVQEAVN